MTSFKTLSWVMGISYNKYLCRIKDILANNLLTFAGFELHQAGDLVSKAKHALLGIIKYGCFAYNMYKRITFVTKS